MARKRSLPAGSTDQPTVAPRPWSFLGGVLLGVFALFLAQLTVREAFVALHRGEYVQDELVVEALQTDPARLYGQIASTGETLTADISVAGAGSLDRYRELQQEGRVKGQRVPVRYLPKPAPWWWWGASDARVLEDWDLDRRARHWFIVATINVAMAAGSFLLIRRGVRQYGGLRPVRDRSVPEPFRAWIDRTKPLPQGVTVLPRTISVSLDTARLVYPGMGCAGMGVAFIALIATTVGWPGIEGIAFLTVSSLLLFGVPLWLARRLWQTIRAKRDQAAGTLRQGILVGPEGVLVRLVPNQCHAIPLDRFVKAEEWRGGSEDSDDYLAIQTRDGRIDFAVDHLAVGAAAVNQVVAAAAGLADSVSLEWDQCPAGLNNPDAGIARAAAVW